MNNRNGTDECGDAGCPQNQHQKMTSPKYALYDNRMRSFKNWPKSFATYQTQSLSETGFFYTGASDKVECFFCGLRLLNWNDNENPMDQHIIYSPNCAFLKMTKGRDYIQQTREKFVVKCEE